MYSFLARLFGPFVIPGIIGSVLAFLGTWATLAGLVIWLAKWADATCLVVGACMWFLGAVIGVGAFFFGGRRIFRELRTLAKEISPPTHGNGALTKD